MTPERSAVITIDAALREAGGTEVHLAADTALTARLCAHVVLLATEGTARREAALLAGRHFGSLLPSEAVHARRINDRAQHGAACAARSSTTLRDQALAQAWVQIGHRSPAPVPPTLPASAAQVSEFGRLARAAARWMAGDTITHAMLRADGEAEPRHQRKEPAAAATAARAAGAIEDLDATVSALPGSHFVQWVLRDWPAYPLEPVGHPFGRTPSSELDPVDDWCRRTLNAAALNAQFGAQSRLGRHLVDLMKVI